MAGAPFASVYGYGTAVGVARVMTGNGGQQHYLVPKGHGAELGTAVDGIGDIDGDFVGDWIVGAPRETVVSGTAVLPSARVVRVISGATGALIRQHAGQTDDGIGEAVAGVGDINGDGHGDALVGAFLQSGTGRAYVISGVNGATLRTHQSNTPNTAWFGRAVAWAGDANGDGVTDYTVAAPRENANMLNEPGTVRVYSGATGALLFLRVGVGANDHFGWSLDVLGDLDGDGVDDLIVGSYPAQGDFSVDLAPGYAEAISGVSGTMLQRVQGVGIGDRFGFAVAGVGDLNNDGNPDVVIGAPKLDGVGTDAGRSSAKALGQ